MPGTVSGIGSAVPFFNTETKRLLRADWDKQTTSVFAEEVFSLLQLLDNYNTKGQANYYQQNQDPPINIYQPTTIPDAPAIRITRYNPFSTGDVPSFPGSGGLYPPFDVAAVNSSPLLGEQPIYPVPGRQDVFEIGPSGMTLNGEPIAGGSTTMAQVTGDDSLSPVALVGQIQSGSGSSYQVKVFGNGANIAGGAQSLIVTATQLQINPEDSIPSGTYVTIIGYPYGQPDATNGIRPVRWYLNVPVWL